MEQFSMNEWWERFAGWVVALLFAATSALMGLWRRQWATDIESLKENDVKVESRLEQNNETLVDHETRLQLMNMQAEVTKTNLAEIKTSITKVHQRIDDGAQAVNDKLDRLLER